MTNKQKSS